MSDNQHIINVYPGLPSKFHTAFAAAQNFIDRAHELAEEGDAKAGALRHNLKRAREELSEAFEVLPEDIQREIMIAEKKLQSA